MEVLTFYKNRLESESLKISKLNKRVGFLAVLRLFAFLIGVAGIYWLKFNVLFVLIGFLIFLSIFFKLVNLFLDAKLELEKAKSKLLELKKEIAQLETNIPQFDSGLEFIDAKHAFSFDLDLFSKTGFFAFVNRTTSRLGKVNLAELLLANTQIKIQKELVEKLSNEMDWMLDYRSNALIESRSSAFDIQLLSLTKNKFENHKSIKLFAVIIPLCSIVGTLLYSFNLLSGSNYSLLLMTLSIPTGFLFKETNKWHNAIGLYESKVKIVLDQLKLIKELNFSLLENEDTLKVGDELKKWTKIAQNFNLRLNILISIPLNIFFAWDLILRLQLEKWSQRNFDKLVVWEEKLAQIDVLISIATLRFNYKNETIFPEFVDTNSYECKDLAHPLIKPNKSVKNDFILKENESFIILTGPNMAGKSTYLRSVGINLIMANAGFPVFAKTFKLPKVQVYSSMRTSDDLASESSYFYAELSRLKYIQEQVENKPSFVILDEILKGTNSKDKEEGSKKFLLKMNRIGAKGIIATHDLSLCTLKSLDSSFLNYYFDSTISGEELTFDYKIKEGVCKNMNASFLLQKMKLVD